MILTCVSIARNRSLDVPTPPPTAGSVSVPSLLPPLPASQPPRPTGPAGGPPGAFVKLPFPGKQESALLSLRVLGGSPVLDFIPCAH